MKLREKLLEDFIVSCDETIKFYEDKPGLLGSRSILDLYKRIALLAKLIQESQKEKESN